MNEYWRDKKVRGTGKPPTRYCWECGKKLYQNYHALIADPLGNVHVTHLNCDNEPEEEEFYEPEN